MAHWLTRTLFSRMIGILLLGLILAQALNRTIHLYQHRQMTDQSSQMQAARRAADLIRLMSVLNIETKQAISEQFHDPFMRLQVAKKSSQTNRTGEPNNPKFKIFRSTLHELLGDQQPARIIITETTPQFLSINILLKDGSTLILKTDLMSHAEEESPVLLHLMIILISITGFSFVAVHWVTRPLQQLANAAEELGKDIHRLPLDESGPIEVSRAAHAFNIMQDRLIHHIQERTQLLAAISHDLKTPITRLRLRSELLEDNDTRARFQKDLDEMENMVMATLDFMRGVDQQEAFQPVDMMALLESLQADAQEMQEQVTIQGAMYSPYRGKPTALKRCISNLLDNAFKYGQRATLFVEDNHDSCIIRVLDQGPGIPKDQIENVFTPYYRLETSRNRDTGGTGLGLSIAQDIAHIHGGHLVLLNNAAGGLEAVLTLSKTVSL
ncbi:MAG: HAMP domain-containing protein [Methylococcaceae bacterium]|nr:HAMP domain-containing protein [Methylococcaceae bacterium]